MNIVSLSPNVSHWLDNTHHPRILHIFGAACNLINERGEVLSIVTPEIGNGPFNLVLEKDVCFSEHISLESRVSIFPNQLNVGNLIIHTVNANLWHPRPNWEMLHAEKYNIATQLAKLLMTDYRGLGFDTGVATTQTYSTNIDAQSLVSTLSLALVNADIPSAQKLTSQLAGLGAGLTPAGDDVIMGALYAAWIIHPPEVVSALARTIANTAAPLTTSLSAAWLRSAGRGEAGILWHEFFDLLVSGDNAAIQRQVTKLLSIGDTSGADALAGFMSTFAFVNVTP